MKFWEKDKSGIYKNKYRIVKSWVCQASGLRILTDKPPNLPGENKTTTTLNCDHVTGIIKESSRTGKKRRKPETKS